MEANQVRPGLRDRKRALTRARIEAAAIDLVLRDGPEAVTVDAISDRADISQRTFFNYFESKEAAILGLQPGEIDEYALSEELGSSETLDPIAAVVSLVAATMGVAGQGNPELHSSRVEIMRRHPEIVGNQFAQLQARRTRFVDHVGKILSLQPQFLNDPDASARANIILSMCVSATRSAVEDWVQSLDDEHVRPTGADETAAIQQRAVALVYSTVGRLT
jgi:AcrR family transcriptional regulator